MRVCSVDGCEDETKARGYCLKHYHRFMRYGNALHVPDGRKKKICIVSGCGKWRYGNGYCQLHYGRFRRHGDPLFVKKKECAWVGCGNMFVQKGIANFFCSEECCELFRLDADKKRTAFFDGSSPDERLEYMRRYNLSEKGKARSKKYLSTEKGKKYNREKSARFRKRQQAKVIAVVLANRHLPNSICSIAECEEVAEKHHEDYSKPLDIVYLCKFHHMKLHYEIRK